MIFTPEGIKKQEFKKSFRGFDTEEVQAFLEKLSTEFEALVNENNSFKTELEETKHKLEKFLQIENKLHQTLSEAEQKSIDIINAAQNKSGEILRLAEEKSAEVLQKSREEAEKLKSAVIYLREEKEILITKLKSIINYQAHLLEMKFEEAGEDVKEVKKPEFVSNLEININEIVNKLL